MGLLLGRPDVTDPRSWIIVDAQALPVEGFETSVVSDSDEVHPPNPTHPYPYPYPYP